MSNCRHTTQGVLDVIRDYPGYAPGCRRWDDRVFHPDQSAAGEQPVSAPWKAPPAFMERIFSVMRVMENAPCGGPWGRFLENEVSLELPSDGLYDAIS